MLASLKFTKGAVSKKDLVPALTHFLLRDGRVEGFNGKLSLSAPIDLDLNCCPRAEPFIKAVEACNETAQLHLTPTGKLSVRSGKFRALVDCIDSEAFPGVVPDGERLELGGKLLPVLEELEPLVGTDASRPWANGVLLDSGSAFVTNNVILAEHWLGYHFPFKVVIPLYAIREMLRIKEEPQSVQVTATSMTAHYSNDRWLRTQLLANTWPDARSMLDSGLSGNERAVDPAFWTALESLSPFVDEFARVFLEPGQLATHADSKLEGASVEVTEQALQGVYGYSMLSLLAPVATHIDFTNPSGRVGWRGGNTRGLILGMRK